MNSFKLFIVLLFFKITVNGQDNIKLITLDPGHFHSALVQKSMYRSVNDTVYVYAENGNDLKLHLERIKSYNNRNIDPTSWKEILYTGGDFLNKMLSEKKGNLVLLAGNNRLKTKYINKSIVNGFNVFADKPMAIDKNGFRLLKKTFSKAKKQRVQLYDIMTERYEITTILQKAFSLETEIFGKLDTGSLENPAVTKESVHHFYKYVSGNVLTRPSWFFDVKQEGEGIVDVTTHLVDLIQWECFPDKIINYKKDIHLINAESWNTKISANEFFEITKEKNIPSYLNNIKDNQDNLYVSCNGSFSYTINGIHAKVSVIWNYKAPEGTGDTHYSLMRGTLSSLIIRQGKEENYKPTLYIQPKENNILFETKLNNIISKVNIRFPGIEMKKNENGWELIIPEKYKDGHESHFAQVTDKYLDYLQKNNMPTWEVPNIIAKYYTTTAARKIASKGTNKNKNNFK